MSDLEFAQNEQMLNPMRAVGMFSKEREYVPFTTECCCYGPVSVFLVLKKISLHKATWFLIQLLYKLGGDLACFP